MSGRKTRIVLSTVLLLSAVVSLMAGGLVTAQDAATPEDWILARAMELTGQAAGDLQVKSVVTANYPSLGEEVIAGKVFNATSREVMVVYVDAEGNAIDRDMAAEELAAKIASGPIEANLRERLAAASPEEMIPVAFWVPGTRAVPSKPELGASREELDAWEVASTADQVTALAAGKESFLAEMAAAGFEPDSVPETSAAIFATLPASAVESLATHPDVVHVFLDEIKMQDLGTGYGDPVRTSRGMRTHKFNDMSGATMNPGVVECCGEVYWSDSYPYAYAGHPYIRGINMQYEGVCPDEDHPTAVVGFLASGHTDNRGQAYNAHVNFTNDCEGDGADLVNSMDWLDSGSGNYADPINHSYGGDTGGVLGDTVSARLDESVYFGYDTNVVAAGNNYGHVEIPAIAYNVIAVGNIDDKQTWGWADDTMRASSSYIDPVSTHGDREKPEVSAAGTNLDSATTSAPWIGPVGSGTSYSSPIVAAAATVAMEGNSLLGGYPETVKAILMATAWNNVEGNWWLSDVDGAGGIDAYRAFLVAYNGTNGAVETGYHACSDGDEQIGSFAVAAGRKARVVLVWSTDPDYADYVNRPGSDMDLEVRAPNGSWYGSYSWDNTYEMVHWDSTPASGGYQVWLDHVRCDEPSGYIYYAWAWSMYQ
jgi:phenylpyruvate tautomerase PptA (4-oxalocrotonate tautomerase family)